MQSPKTRPGLTLRMRVTQCCLSHVRQLDCPLGARVHEHVAMYWVELGRRYHLRQLLHVDRFDVDDVWDQYTAACLPALRGLTKALVADVQVPQVDPQIICRDVRLPVRVDADRVDVVSVRIGVHFARDRSGDAVVRGHAG